MMEINFNGAEVTDQSQLSTGQTLIQGNFNNNGHQKVFDNLHAQSGQTRYFKCGLHPGSKFKIQCSASRRRLSEQTEADVTVQTDANCTDCTVECTGYEVDGVCNAHSECLDDEYESSPGTETTDSVCGIAMIVILSG